MLVWKFSVPRVVASFVQFSLDRIKKAHDRNPDLASLQIDPEFAKEIVERQSAWWQIVTLAINAGVSVPGMSV